MISTRLTTIAPSSPPSNPRVVFAHTRAGRAVLDGAWWPRSWDPVAELPGLVVALSDHYGPIRQLMLNRGTWGNGFRRLAVGRRMVRMGWFASLDPALAIATTAEGDQLDLLVVPPQTSTAMARRAMAIAAAPTNTVRAPDILVTLAATPAPMPDTDPTAAWDNEGGHLGLHQPRPHPRR